MNKTNDRAIGKESIELSKDELERLINEGYVEDNDRAIFVRAENWLSVVSNIDNN